MVPQAALLTHFVDVGRRNWTVRQRFPKLTLQQEKRFL